jgi:hypothetical protein
MLRCGAVTNLDPYRAPSAATDQDPQRSELPEPCPKCGARSASKVGYNWWGGALGPRLFHVVKCHQCSTQYNGKTGGTLTRVIIGYQVVVLAVLIVAFFFVREFFLSH